MKHKFQVYKNLILVVASALTLIAVTFAWFSTSNSGLLSTIKNEVANNLVNVSFYESNGAEGYNELDGEITLDDCVAGNYKQYRMIIQTNTADKMKINFSIDGLPSNMPAALKNSVCIKYEMKKASRSEQNGVISYTDGDTISASNGYVPLSGLSEGVIFSGISLSDYQSSKNDFFVIYYEIGLSENSPTSIEGLSSSLGNVSISAQTIG